MRIVIDTNIWVSGLLWKGEAWRLLNLAEKGEVELCVAYPMILELEEVLAYERFQSRLEVIRQTPFQLATYALQLAKAFEITRNKPPIVTADPDDDLFLLCAVEANARYVVTHDRHLLALKIYANIPIVNIQDFFAREFEK